MTATRTSQTTTNGPRLHLAFELSWNQWKLAFTIGHGQPPRLRTIAARDLETLLKEIHKAKRRFGLPDDAAVLSCYEAGRDGGRPLAGYPRIAAPSWPVPNGHFGNAPRVVIVAAEGEGSAVGAA